jgi:hypothetical protein
MTRDRAETLGLDALTYLAGDPERLDRFLLISGLDELSLRERASEPEVLRAVVEYLLTDDELVTGFCSENGLDPRDMHVASHLLGES